MPDTDADDPDADGVIDVLVLKEDVHGIPSEEYVAALRERLPDRRVELARTPERRTAMLARARAATGLTVPEGLAAADRLELFACTFAGADHLPLAELEERGVAVTTASGVHGPNAAEHAVGGLLSVIRRFHVARRRGERREWRHYRADELAGSTVCVVGQGPIGTSIVERLNAFAVETLAVRYTPEKGGPADRVLGHDRFPEAAGEADHLVLACPLTEETRGMVDADALRALPADAALVNVARGEVLDTDALVEAVRGERLAGAVLDVTDPEPLPADHPLWSFGNVLITPHVAGHTPHYYERLADVVAGNVRLLAEGETDLENRVV